MSDEKQDDWSQLTLESPPASDLPAGGDVGLMAAESVAATTAKCVGLEGFFALLTRDLVFNDFMREVLLIIMKVVRCEAGSVFEFDYQNQCLFFRAAVGQVSDRLSKFTVPAGKGIVGHVAESRQPTIVDHLEENKVHLRAIGKTLGFEARNLVAIPIVIRGRTFGVLELLNRVGDERFTNEDVELLTYLCQYAAKAIELRLMIGFAMAGKKAA